MNKIFSMSKDRLNNSPVSVFKDIHVFTFDAEFLVCVSDTCTIYFTFRCPDQPNKHNVRML